MVALASRLEAIATSNKKLLGWRPSIASRLEAIITSSKKLLGWRPSLLVQVTSNKAMV